MGRADGSGDADRSAAPRARDVGAALAGVGADVRGGERLGGSMTALSNSIMRAAVFHGHERITIERTAMPDVGKGEAMVRVSRTALCGSDFKLWHQGGEVTAGHHILD